MANTAIKTFLNRNLSHSLKNISNPTRWNNASGICCLKLHHTNVFNNETSKRHTDNLLPGISSRKIQIRFYSKDEPPIVKLSLYQRFKQMYKDYWYVLVPVHLVTSAAWFGSFYYMAKSGVDIVAILESWNVSDKITNSLKDSSMGYLAVAYACYKIATPIRYTVTLGGTTISINYMKKWGYIKPIPSAKQLQKIYQEGKDNLMETVRETKEGIKAQGEKLKDKKENIMGDLNKSIFKIEELSDKIKNKGRVIAECNKKTSAKDAYKK